MTVINKYTGEEITILAPVPTSLGWAIKKAFFTFLWYGRDPRTTMPFDKFYYGLIEHKCEFDCASGKYDWGLKIKWLPCKHYGCNMVEPVHL